MKRTGATGRSRRGLVALALVVVLAALVAVVLVVFQPQRLFIDTRVDEALPGLSAAGAADAVSPGSAPNATSSGNVALPTTVAQGSFTSIAHPTEGTALLVKLPDGSHVVRLEQLATDNGPDVWVGLSNAHAGSGDYSSLRRLEPLKGNIGNQNYAVPADVDLAGVQSVVIWCERFSVAFGDAPLMSISRR